MHSATELISEATSLPVEDRVFIVHSLLKSLNSPSPEIDSRWGQLAQNRLEQIRSGSVKLVSGAEVQTKVQARFSK